MNIPSTNDIQKLHEKHAPDTAAYQSVWVHCRIVRDIALQIAASRPSVSQQLLEAGALLHDIGVYRLYIDGKLDTDNYITHGLLGYELLRDEGLDEAVCRFALLHTGVGLSEADVRDGNLPLPVRDYVAETDEEKIVMYADKFHSKSLPPRFNARATYRNFLQSKFGEGKAGKFDTFVAEFGEPDLTPLIKSYGHELK